MTFRASKKCRSCFLILVAANGGQKPCVRQDHASRRCQPDDEIPFHACPAMSVKARSIQFRTRVRYRRALDMNRSDGRLMFADEIDLMRVGVTGRIPAGVRHSRFQFTRRDRKI